MATVTYEFKDFSGGDYGRLQAWRAPKNSFSATNMLVYRTGELGVRAGLRNVTPSSVGNGAVWALARRPNFSQDVWYIQGTSILVFQANASVTTATAGSGTLTSTPTAQVAVDDAGATQYLATINSGCFKVQGSLGAVVLSNLASSPNARAISLYGDRLVVVPQGSPDEVQYNGTTAGVSDFTQWPASNVIKVGSPDDGITSILTQRGHLSILKTLSGLYVLTGVPGVNDTLRAVTRQIGPFDYNQAARTFGSDMIWFVPATDMAPASFNGATVSAVPNIAMPLDPGDAVVAAVPLFQDDAEGIAFVQPASASLGTANRVWLRTNGTWTKHTFNAVLTTMVASGTGVYTDDGGASLTDFHATAKLTFTDGGGAGVHPKFYTWLPLLDRPGFETTNPATLSAERAGDDATAQVTGSVTFPEQHTDDGSEIMVRGVIVHFRKWNTGGSLTNHFDLNVDVLRSYTTPSPIVSATQSWDEAGSAAAAAGTVQSQYFSFGDQGRGGGFQLAFSNVRGIAFQRIQVIAETYPSRV